MNNEGIDVQKNDAKTVIVLGMHRTGTSMTAGVLHRLGVNMGNNMLPANRGNPLGLFEDAEFVHLNEKILEKAGGKSSNPPSHEAVCAQKYFFEDTIKSLIKKKTLPLWGWKDPRTSLTIELYLPYLTNPYFIICRRNIEAICKSLNKRDRMNIDYAKQLVITYENRIINFLYNHKNLPVIEWEYDNALQDPARFVNSISSFLNLKINREKVNSAKSSIFPNEEVRRLSKIMRQHSNKVKATSVNRRITRKKTKPTYQSEPKKITAITSDCARAADPQKRVLLATSAAPAQSPFSTGEKRAPIGIGYLISVLREAGHKVYFIDNYLQPSHFLDTDFLKANQIDFVGIYVNTICFRDTLRMLYKLRQLRQTGKWNGKIIVGGPHTTVAPETIPQFVDYIVQGEGERAILDIVNDKIKERIVHYPRIKELDTLPMPAWDYFAQLPYDWSVKFFDRGPVFPMNTSRGCPFECTFCSVNSIWGRKYTYFSAERIVSDIEHLIAGYGVKGIYFREDNFTLNQERLRRFCKLLIDKEINIPWACESRVSNLNRELIELMSRAGAKGFYFGVESGSQRILDLLNKNITTEQVRRVFSWCHEFNIKTAASIIVEVPGETEADRKQTGELLKQIKPDVIWTNVFVGIPKSNLYRYALKKRLYEFIDDRGLVYLQGHNDKIKRYKKGDRKACVPNGEDNKDVNGRPRVSVLLPVYNSEQFVRQALNSIYGQTYQDFEVIIVDDGSTDKTPDILQELKDCRTFIYRNADNMGLTRTLNIGLKLCRGEYIARMDADDISLSDRIEKQVQFLDKNPDCAAAGTWCKRINSNGDVFEIWRHPTQYEDIKKKLQFDNSIIHGSAMVRKESILAIGGYNEQYKYSQDYDLWLRLSELAEIRNVNECLYLSRASTKSIGATKRKQQQKFAQMARQQSLLRKCGRASNDSANAESTNLIKVLQKSLQYFLNAQKEFENSRFASAQMYMQEYKRLIDYSKLSRIINTPQQKDKDISVIIVTYNRDQELLKCLQCLRKQSDSGFEVIVVDNGRNSSQQVRRSADQYIDCPINFNLSEGRNIGAHFACGSIAVFLDDDALVEPDYISSIRSAFDKYDIAGLRGRAFPKTEQSGEDEMRIYDLGEKPFPTYCNQEGNSAFHLEIYKNLGGMDPLLFGHEGSDLTYRIINASGQVNKVIYWPDTIIYHDRTCGETLQKKRLIHQRSADYLRYKHNDNIFINRWQISSHPLPVKGTVEKPVETPASGSKKPIGYPWEKTQHKFETQAKAEYSTKQKGPKVSIIISCYNCEQFLAECIDSVREQTLQDWELFLLDDGSEDGTRELIEKYARSDERIRPYYFDDNAGPYIRRNFAIDKAKSDFIVIQDADDIMSPEKLELMYREINKDEKLGVVGSFYRAFLEELISVEYAEDVILPVTHREIMERYRTARYICWHGSAIIRKSLFELIGPYDENPFGSDKLWLSKAAELAGFTDEVKFKNIPQFLTLKREHPLSQQGRLPPLDTRSRRTKFQNYWETKFENIREKARTNSHTNIAEELRNCICSDYLERFSHQFEQWESEPLDSDIFYTYLDRSVAQLAEKKYVSCIITLDSLSRMVQGVEKMFSCYDLLRGLACFGVSMDVRSKYYLEQEFANHSTDSAVDFVKKYLGPDSPDFGAGRRKEIIENTIFPFGTDSRDDVTDDDIIKNINTCGKQKPVKLSIVIYATSDIHLDQHLSGLLRTLDKQSDHSFEVLVLNSTFNNNAFNRECFTDKLHYRTTFVEIENGLLPTKARNIATRLSNGRYLVFLPGDVGVSDDFAAGIIKRFENNNISGLRGKIVDQKDGYLPEYYNLGDESTYSAFDIEEFFAVRKDVLLRLGGFNENLPKAQALELSFKIYTDQQIDTGPILYCPEIVGYLEGKRFSAGNDYISKRIYFQYLKRKNNDRESNEWAFLRFLESLYPSKREEIQFNARWMLNNALFFEKRFPEVARFWAQKAFDIEPDSLKIRYILGSSYLEQGMYQQAWQLFEKIISRLYELLKSGKENFSGMEFDTAEQAAEFYLSSCTKAAQCLMKLRKYGRLKKVYENLLRTPRVKIPPSQAVRIEKVLGKLQGIGKSAPGLTAQNPAFAPNGPEVSVILPAYNAAEYIGQAIQSVLKQTHSNWELVVVNDGSTDETEQIVKSFKDKRIKYFSRQNQGLAASYNTAVKHSRGSFIIRLDADDMISPEYIESHLVKFKKYPQVDLVYCDDLLIDENAKPIRVIKRPEYKNRELLIRELFRNGYPVVPFRGCIKKSVFEKIGFFDEQLLVAEDYDMMRRFVKEGLKIKHLNGAMYLRRMTTNSLSRKTSSQKAESHFEVLKRFTKTFSCEELFPEIDWENIPQRLRPLHFRSMVAQVYLTIGKAYVQSNAPALTETACRYASSELKQCLQMEPGNEQLKELFEKCELAGRQYQTT